LNAGSATKIAVNQVWNKASCQSAQPIRNWTLTAWVMFGVHMFALLIFMFNSIWGNDGNQLHAFWLFIARIAIVFVLVDLTLLLLVWFSYGTRN
jgi:hypothetical protein